MEFKRESSTTFLDPWQSLTVYNRIVTALMRTYSTAVSDERTLRLWLDVAIKLTNVATRVELTRFLEMPGGPIGLATKAKLLYYGTVDGRPVFSRVCYMDKTGRTGVPPVVIPMGPLLSYLMGMYLMTFRGKKIKADGCPSPYVFGTWGEVASSEILSFVQNELGLGETAIMKQHELRRLYLNRHVMFDSYDLSAFTRMGLLTRHDANTMSDYYLPWRRVYNAGYEYGDQIQPVDLKLNPRIDPRVARYCEEVFGAPTPHCDDIRATFVDMEELLEQYPRESKGVSEPKDDVKFESKGRTREFEIHCGLDASPNGVALTVRKQHLVRTYYWTKSDVNLNLQPTVRGQFVATKVRNVDALLDVVPVLDYKVVLGIEATLSRGNVAQTAFNNDFIADIRRRLSGITILSVDNKLVKKAWLKSKTLFKTMDKKTIKGHMLKEWVTRGLPKPTNANQLHPLTDVVDSYAIADYLHKVDGFGNVAILDMR